MRPSNSLSPYRSLRSPWNRRSMPVGPRTPAVRRRRHGGAHRVTTTGLPMGAERSGGDRHLKPCGRRIGKAPGSPRIVKAGCTAGKTAAPCGSNNAATFHRPDRAGPSGTPCGDRPWNHGRLLAGRAPGPPAPRTPSGVVRRTGRTGLSWHSPHCRPAVVSRRLFRRAGLPVHRARARCAWATRSPAPALDHRRAGQPEPQLPALWAEQQNAAGGLNVKGPKRPDRADRQRRPEQHRDLRAHFSKLMGGDKVDLVLPPRSGSNQFRRGADGTTAWATHLAPTALSRRLIEMKLPYFFLMLQQPKPMMDALVDMLQAGGAKTTVVIYVDDLFGLENYAALKVALAGTGIGIVEEQEHPLGVKDLSPVLRSMKDQEPDAFIGLTYPPDHHPGQPPEQGDRPSTRNSSGSVGTAFQLYRNVMGPRRRGRARHGLVEQQDQPGRQGLLRCPRGQVRRTEGTRPLGQRRHLGGAGDPHRRGGQGGAWTARRSATMWPATSTPPSSARSSSPAARTWAHAGRGVAVAEGRSSMRVVWPKGRRRQRAS